MDLSVLTMWLNALTFEPAARQIFANTSGMVWLQDLTVRRSKWKSEAHEVEEEVVKGQESAEEETEEAEEEVEEAAKAENDEPDVDDQGKEEDTVIDIE